MPEKIIDTFTLGPYEFQREEYGNRVNWSRNRLPREGSQPHSFQSVALEEDAQVLAEEVLKLRKQGEQTGC